MTVQGTVDRTAILLAILTLTAIVPWRIAFGGGDPGALMPLLGLGPSFQLGLSGGDYKQYGLDFALGGWI